MVFTLLISDFCVVEEKNSTLEILYTARHIHTEARRLCRMMGLIGFILPKQEGNKFPSIYVTII